MSSTSLDQNASSVARGFLHEGSSGWLHAKLDGKKRVQYLPTIYEISVARRACMYSLQLS
jgi:hypothetical protein